MGDDAGPSANGALTINQGPLNGCTAMPWVSGGS
jgi:hypothetical protein